VYSVPDTAAVRCKNAYELSKMTFGWNPDLSPQEWVVQMQVGQAWGQKIGQQTAEEAEKELKADTHSQSAVR
jgi:hypothetical protein